MENFAIEFLGFGKNITQEKEIMVFWWCEF